jgi:hypothetical protein
MTTAASQLGCPLPVRRRVRDAAHRWLVRVAGATASCVLAAHVSAQQPAPPADAATASAATATPLLTRAEQETFLREARIIRARAAPKGITGSRRVTLTNGVVTHDAHVQSIDETQRTFQGARGVELNFRDSWRYNVAAYRLSVLLDLDMVPVTVQRHYDKGPAAFTWWVDDLLMDEGTRLKQKVRVPDARTWNQQMYVVRVFDQLIYNIDRNVGNLLITADWRVWMIDHTRAFRHHRTLRAVSDLKGCDRTLLARLEALDKATIERELSAWLDLAEMDGLLARRDAIVAFFRSAPPEALFDLPRRTVVVEQDAAASGAPMHQAWFTAAAWQSALRESGPHRR